MHFGKQLAEQRLKGLVLGALVELAHKVAAGLEGFGGEGQGGVAEVLGWADGVSCLVEGCCECC